jgi:uncharacterized protein YidB (DUF937 family)
MANDFLGQILGSVLGNANSGRQELPGGLGDLGGLGGALGNVFGRGPDSENEGVAARSPLGGGRGALLAMLLPLAMQWVQRNGGIGAVLNRFRQQGYSQQAASWVATGENEPMDPQAVGDVIGTEELSRMSQQLGVPNEQIASGMADILPQVVDHLTPAGEVRSDADDVLSAGLAAVERMLGGQR